MIPMMAITPSKMDRKTLGLPTFFYTGFGLLEVSLNTDFSLFNLLYSAITVWVWFGLVYGV
jgi:hypothetical protein